VNNAGSIEDYAAEAELLGIGQHRVAPQPTQLSIPPVWCDNKAGICRMYCPFWSVRLEIKRPDHTRRASAIRHIGRHSALAVKPIIHEVIVIREPVMRIGCSLVDNGSIESPQRLYVSLIRQCQLNWRIVCSFAPTGKKRLIG
jgi:hypothetical protein